MVQQQNYMSPELAISLYSKPYKPSKLNIPNTRNNSMNTTQLIRKETNKREQVFSIPRWVAEEKFNDKRELDEEEKTIFVLLEIIHETEKAFLAKSKQTGKENWIPKSFLKVWITETGRWEQVV